MQIDLLTSICFEYNTCRHGVYVNNGKKKNKAKSQWAKCHSWLSNSECVIFLLNSALLHRDEGILSKSRKISYVFIFRSKLVSSFLLSPTVTEGKVPADKTQQQPPMLPLIASQLLSTLLIKHCHFHCVWVFIYKNNKQVIFLRMSSLLQSKEKNKTANVLLAVKVSPNL